MRIAMRHRAAMVPYIYTEAKRAYDTGIYATKYSNRTLTTCNVIRAMFSLQELV